MSRKIRTSLEEHQIRDKWALRNLINDLDTIQQSLCRAVEADSEAVMLLHLGICLGRNSHVRTRLNQLYTKGYLTPRHDI